MPQFAVLIYAQNSQHALDATPEELRECDEHAASMAESGAMTLAYALTPRDLATTVRRDGVAPGSYHPDMDVVVGFYVLDVPDLDAALELVRRDPAIMTGGGVEVRPVHSGGVVSRGS